MKGENMKSRISVIIATFVFILGICAAVGAYDRTCSEPAVIFDESGDMTAPEVVTKVDPKYPEEAKKEGVSGKVVLDVVIDSKGAVVDVNVLEDPDARLSAAAADAVRQWRFEPARDSRGKPIAVCYVLTVKFHLK